MDEYCGSRTLEHEWFPSRRELYCRAKSFEKRMHEQWVQPRRAALAEAPVEVLTYEADLPLSERFHELADKWQRETKHISSITKRVLHPSYQTILGMGGDVVPLLLRDLRDNRRPWFWALSHITQENPISPADAGRMDKMVAAWLLWGKKRGLL